MKYKITNKQNRKFRIVESRKRPNVDVSIFGVKRIREKVTVVTSNQRKRAQRAERIEKSKNRKEK